MPCGVGRASGNERRHGTRFRNALLEDLPVFSFLVIQQAISIDWLIELAHVGINTTLAKQCFHTEGARFIRHDGHNQPADIFVAQELGQETHIDHGGRHRPVFRAPVKLLKHACCRNTQRCTLNLPLWHIAPETLAALVQVLDLRALLWWTVKRRFG